MTQKIGNLCLLAKLALLGILQANSAQGAILFDSTSAIEVDSFWEQQWVNVNEGGAFDFFLPPENDDKFYAFNEAQNVTLPSSLGVQEFADNIQNDWDTLTFDDPEDFIPEGTTVSSHMIYLASDLGGGLVKQRARVSFERDIIGFNGDFKLFFPDNDLFAPNALNQRYTNTGLEGITGSLPVDLVTLVDPKTIELDWRIYNGVDALRVITYGDSPVSAPEPTTILGTGLFLGFVTLFKRKSLKSKRVST